MCIRDSPHGDASIGDALVQMGQKDLLIDTQGNWGNILTGDRAAAPRYICLLYTSVDRTMGLLRKELMIRKGELEEQLFFSSLERIFIEERIYKERKFEQRCV